MLMLRLNHKKINGNFMKITKIWLVSFSPTRTSKKVIDAIASGIRDIPFETIDLTYPDNFSKKIHFAADELVIIGVPVYAGRVAPLAVKRLETITGNNTPAVIVVTYGNREFEDALIELRDIAMEAGLNPLAACSFIGEHSFSGIETPIGAGRPDSVDLAAAEAFGEKIMAKIAAVVENPATEYRLEVPGNIPYKAGMGSLPFTPMVNHSQCTLCAECITSCPAGAISLASEIEIDPKLCIFCCACVKNCLQGAMEIDAKPIKEKRQWLYEHCAERKEPELYL